MATKPREGVKALVAATTKTRTFFLRLPFTNPFNNSPFVCLEQHGLEYRQ